MKEQYLKDVNVNFTKILANESKNKIIDLITSNIRACISNEEHDYATMHYLVGMNLTFKGWVVKK